MNKGTFRQYKAFCKVGDSASALPHNFRVNGGFLIGYFILIISIVTSVGATDGFTGQSVLPAFDVSFLSCIIIYLVSRAFAFNPRLKEVPMTYKRRAAYTLFFTYTVIFCFVLVCAGVYVLAMELCKIYVPYEILEDGTRLTYVYPEVNGYAFYALRYIFAPAAAIVAARLNGAKNIIFTIAVCAFYAIGNFLPNIIFDMTKNGIDGAISLNGNTIYALGHIAFGGAYVAVYGVITAAVVAWSVAIVFKREKPSRL